MTYSIYSEEDSMLRIELFANYSKGKVCINIGNGFDSSQFIEVDIEEFKKAVEHVAKDLSENE